MEDYINKNNLPEHIAIIMDGNGRWAKKRKLPRIAGHREGVRTVRKITKICGELNIKTLTLYTFSSENWKRPKNEINALMKLLVNSIQIEVNELIKNNVCFTIIGEINDFNPKIQNALLDAINSTKHNSGLNLNLALSYGGRQEILTAVHKIADQSINIPMKKNLRSLNLSSAVAIIISESYRQLNLYNY